MMFSQIVLNLGEVRIMTNEEIALELVKAWCMQPSTAANCFKMWEVLNSYEEALEKLEEIRKDESVNDLVSCEEESEEDCEGSSEGGTDDSVEAYEKRFRSLKIKWSEEDKEQIIDALTKGV